jgi:hypothetical protein
MIFMNTSLQCKFLLNHKSYLITLFLTLKAIWDIGMRFLYCQNIYLHSK